VSLGDVLLEKVTFYLTSQSEIHDSKPNTLSTTVDVNNSNVQQYEDVVECNKTRFIDCFTRSSTTASVYSHREAH